MSTQVKHILSNVQSDLGDLSKNMIQLGEYLDLFADIALHIARDAHVWVNRYTCIPNPLTEDWQNSHIYVMGSIVYVTNTYYLCKTNHTSNTSGVFADDTIYWTELESFALNTLYAINDVVFTSDKIFYRCIKANTSDIDNQPPHPEYWQGITGSLTNIYRLNIPASIGTTQISPFKLIRVVRQNGENYEECREYSVQAILRTLSGNDSFDVNRLKLDRNSFAVIHTNLADETDSSLTLLFGERFGSDERVIIDYISMEPFGSHPIDKWTIEMDQVIPKFMEHVFQFGILWLCSERLYSQGNDKYRDRSTRYKQYFEQELKECAAYAKGFKDLHHSIRMQPLNWLGEQRLSL